jgi:hypothetical protein
MAEPCGGEVELHMFGCAQRVGANPMRSPVPIARNTVDLMEVADSSARLALEHQFANDKRSLPGDVKGLRAETVVNGQSGSATSSLAGVSHIVVVPPLTSGERLIRQLDWHVTY